MRDLSGQLLSDRGLIASSSMAPAGGSLSIVPDGGQPGSDSEASEGVAARTPGFSMPDMTVTTTIVSGQDGTSYSPWAAADGSPWKESTSSDREQPARSRDQSGRWIEQ